MLRVGSSKTLNPSRNTSPKIYVCKRRKSIYDFNDFLRIKSWDFVSILGLADMSGTRDFRPHGRWPLVS